MVKQTWKEELKYATRSLDGALFVIDSGLKLILWLSVGLLASVIQMVNRNSCLIKDAYTTMLDIEGDFQLPCVLNFIGSITKFDGVILPIAMDFVSCSGSELRLWDCIHFTHSYGLCSHSDDAGIRCQPGYKSLSC